MALESNSPDASGSARLSEIRALLEAAAAPHATPHDENWDSECQTCRSELILETKAIPIVRNLLDHLSAAEQRIKTWRDWTQFVYANGGPVPTDRTDDDLRTMVTNAHDAEVNAAEQRADELHRAWDAENERRHDAEEQAAADKEAADAAIRDYASRLQAYTALLTKAEGDMETYRTLAAIGTWHDECRPNREMAARELQKSQAVIDKLADQISAVTQRAEAAEAAAEAARAERDEWKRLAEQSSEKHRAIHGRISALMFRAEQAEADHARLRAALVEADRFISNGIALGYITMPDKDCPDSAHQTPGIVKAALASSLTGRTTTDEDKRAVAEREVFNIVHRGGLDCTNVNSETFTDDDLKRAGQDWGEASSSAPQPPKTTD